MNDELVEMVCIVDRSGSMDAISSDAIGGFNSFIEGQKQQPGQARFTLVLFDHEYLVVHESEDIARVPPLDATTYVPRGTTALLDAIGRTIDDVGKRLHDTPEPERPGTVIIAILTDGMENASKDYTQNRIAAMIKHQQEKYDWQFLFLAANQDAIATAGSLSIDAQDAQAYQATPEGIRDVYAELGQAVNARRQGRRGDRKA